MPNKKQKRLEAEVKKKGYVPGTLISKANQAKEKRLSRKEAAIRGLI